MPTRTIDSSRFGTLEIASEDVIEFPNGLIGLGGNRYAIVATSEDGAFSWLHSIDDPSLALPVANPWHFFGEYAVVNGKVWPYLAVKRGLYRFRLLNASNFRGLQLELG